MLILAMPLKAFHHRSHIWQTRQGLSLGREQELLILLSGFVVEKPRSARAR